MYLTRCSWCLSFFSNRPTLHFILSNCVESNQIQQIVSGIQDLIDIDLILVCCRVTDHLTVPTMLLHPVFDFPQLITPVDEVHLRLGSQQVKLVQLLALAIVPILESNPAFCLQQFGRLFEHLIVHLLFILEHLCLCQLIKLLFEFLPPLCYELQVFCD